MTDADIIRIMVVALIVGLPLAFLAGYIARGYDMKAFKRELQESRYAYLARLDDHQKKWKDWTDKAMHEAEDAR